MTNPCEGLDKRTNDYKNCMERFKESREIVQETEAFSGNEQEGIMNGEEAQEVANGLAEYPIQIDLEDMIKEVTEAKGIGDVVESITKATGIKKAVEFIKGEDCGCDERKKKLNKLSWWRKTKKVCLTETEYNILDEVYKGDKKPTPSSVFRQRGMQGLLTPIHNRMFYQQHKIPTNCAECLNEINNRLHAIYTNYEKK